MQTATEATVERESPADVILRNLDTSEYSFVHWFSRCLGVRAGEHVPLWLIGAMVGVALTLLPLLVSALLEYPWRAMHVPTGHTKLPLLRDLNVLCMFAVSLPLILAFTVDDQRLLASAMNKVVHDDILSIEPAPAAALIERWGGHFSRINCVAQTIGVAVGLAVAYANYVAYRDPRVGLWTTGIDGFTRTGWIYLWAIFVFYWVCSVFVIRNVSVSVFLWQLVSQSTIKLVPFHPDHCSGLRVIGNLGLRNQYTLTIIGVNVALLFVVYPRYLGALPGAVDGLMFAALVAYIVCGPPIFAGPLIPFRAGMQRAKETLVNIVAKRLRSEMSQIRDRLQSGVVTKEDEELIERLRKIGVFVEEFPVWPFDARTLAKFSAAYLMPLLILVATELIKVAIKTAPI